MSGRRWAMLIGSMTVIGMAKVAQQTTLSLSAYRLGRTYVALHDVENQASWMRTKVIALNSPIYLAKTMREKHVALVAWASLPEPSAQAAAPVAILPTTKSSKVPAGAPRLAKAEATDP